MADWKKLQTTFTSLLKLAAPPVAISFRASAPQGVRKFMGSVPSSCSFWRVAETAPAGQSAFVTAPTDHYNCPIGSYTHNVELPKDRAHELTDVLGLMAQLGYVRMEEVPSIPRWSSPPQAIVYSHLADAPTDPDVVLFSLSAQTAMLLAEAAKAADASAHAEPMGRPTCMALPAAAKNGATLSLGCIGNRIYTDIAEGSLYMVVRATDLAKIAERLQAIVSANLQLAEYHQQRKSTLLKT